MPLQQQRTGEVIEVERNARIMIGALKIITRTCGDLGT